jgi:hypothetical protein
MLMQRTQDGSVVVKYLDSEEPDAAARVTVRPLSLGEGYKVEVRRAYRPEVLYFHLSEFDSLALQAALAMVNVPPAPGRRKR